MEWTARFLKICLFFSLVLSRSLLCVLYAGCLVFRQSLFPLPLSQTDPFFVGGRAGLTAVSQGPSSIADKHVCPSTACTRLCGRAFVCVSLSSMHRIKAHDTGAPTGRPDTVHPPHILINISSKKDRLLSSISGGRTNHLSVQRPRYCHSFHFHPFKETPAAKHRLWPPSSDTLARFCWKQ